MAAPKYGKYFIESPIKQGRFCPRLVFYSREHEAVGEKNYSVVWNCIMKPFLMVQEAHSHEFDQFLHFYGGDPSDITRFDAEVELSLGDECEVHVITRPTVVYIPKNMMHCPLNFKVVNQPIIFMNVALNPEYVSTHVPPGK
jgi:hypothetical protein